MYNPISSELTAEFEKVILDSINESLPRNYRYIEIVNLAVYTTNVITWSDKKKVDFIVSLLPKVKDLFIHSDYYSHRSEIIKLYFTHLTKMKLALDDEDIKKLCHAFFVETIVSPDFLGEWPISWLIKQIEKQWRNKTISTDLRETLLIIKDKLSGIRNCYHEKERLRLLVKMDNLIYASENSNDKVRPVFFIGNDDFTDYVNKMMASKDETEKFLWYHLLAIARTTSGTKPSKKYLTEANLFIQQLGSDKFLTQLNDWFLFITNLKEKQSPFVDYFDELISTENTDAVKGLLWMSSLFNNSTTTYHITELAERCYKKIPGQGAIAVALGNACLYTLSKLDGFEGIAQLSRLKRKVKQPSTQELIEKYLREAATEQGISVHEIEDLAIESFGLIKGSKTALFNNYTAQVSIVGVGKTEIKWFKPDGTTQKAPPSFVKEEHAEQFIQLKNTAKKVEQTLTLQRDRIDRMLRTNRTWKWSNFETQYWQHAVMYFLTQKIIWNFEENNTKTTVLYFQDQWIDSNNQVVIPTLNTIVSLWHPATATVAEVKKWRDFLTTQQIQQPIKQAFREVYLLTEAEINTQTYSNRMAAHILKQHQFNSLAKVRGWKYSLLGNFDGGNQMTNITLPEFNLTAQFWVDGINADNNTGFSGIWIYVSTDQIRFVDTLTNRVVNLVDVPVIPFSEVLRDVDLFVGVASVGNDPTWQDTSGLPVYRDYWASYSFGDLSETAKTRKEILTTLVPRLKIAKVSEIKDNYLVVKGKLRTYKIHLGSTNILMEPNDQYLCIVPDRNAKKYTENLFLPFEGDNTLSVILSKAFLLASDDKITDTTITSQINQK